MGQPADAAGQPIAYVNGKRYNLPTGRAEATLLQWLRELGLTGTKLGCGEGGCGACTVMVSSCQDDKLVHRSVNACLCPLYAVEGMHVVTVEGLGNPRDGLHPVQERLSKAHGSQCGFCTPGFVMSMYSLLRSKPEAPTEEEIEENLAGNLCRCTGYRPILDAFKVFAKADPLAYTEESIAACKDAKSEAILPRLGEGSGSSDDEPSSSNGPAQADGGQLVNGHATAGAKKAPGKVCPSTGRPCDCGAGAPEGDAAVVSSSSEEKTRLAAKEARQMAPCEPIFPAELRRRQAPTLDLPGPLAAWHRPTTLEAVLALKKEHPAAKMVVGNTEVGIEMKFKHAVYPVLIGATHVPELNEIKVDDAGITVGASVTLSSFMDALRGLIKSRPAPETGTFKALVEQMRYFAGNQIRNTAGVGGNIVTGSPISDLNPIYMAARAVFTTAGAGTKSRTVPASDFFLGYRKVDLQEHEILLKVQVPFTRQHEYVKEFKQAHRRDDDIAIVNAGMRFQMGQAEAGWVVQEAAVAYGGVAAKTIMGPATAKALCGQPLTQETLHRALQAVAEDVNISANAPGGMVEFRRSLASSFLFRMMVFVSAQLEAAQAPGFTSSFSGCDASAAQPFERPAAQGLQYFAKTPGEAAVGQPHRHMAADLQVSGEAKYTDDMPLPPGGLHAVLVMSTKPHAKLVSVDPSQALKVPGVEGFFTHKDVPGGNDIGAVLHDEACFAVDEVTCVGHPIGIVVADTEQHARMAALLVSVEYEELPAIISIEDAIEAGSFIDGWGHRLECGDVESVLGSGECAHVLEGECRMGGQDHFYLEPHCCLVVPAENSEMAMWASTQAPTKHQQTVAHVLGLPHHKVVCHVKRLGGGFGGKESRSAHFNACAAVPAWHTRKAVRLCLDRDEDMQLSGHRHAFLGKYKVGFDREGKLLALDVQLYNNAGNSLDLSAAIMDRALLHTDNAYKIPHLRVVGHICKTHCGSNTAFRGFGGPQGMLVTEMWLDRVARTVGKPLQAVRELNLYSEGDKTHYGQILNGCQVKPCWENVTQHSQLAERQAAAEKFNRDNRWRKRGISVIPTKFGISFTTKFLNQAGALVHVYTDGTVLVTHGGVEMGQGLHTKVAQVAAADLGIPLDSVYIAETATDKVPNSSPTAASASSDMYGAATSDACRQLNERLAPYREARPDATFKELINAAYLDRVDLSAHGFYATPDITGFGDNMPFNYFCYGAAASEVELDTLTGDFHILRTDICMDVGKTLNPAIDIGQVEGGFIQGMGWLCIEELVWGDKEHKWVRPGMLFTKGPGTYKIPTANDIPIDFRVTLLKDGCNQRLPQVYSSKAVGEPPFFLGASVFFALKEAAYAARVEAGETEWFEMDSPATPERLRLACIDQFTAPFASAKHHVKTSC